MTKPKITVIIPVYNAGKYLNKMLTSVFKQSLKELQIICVDDGSTDNSSKILKKYEDKLIILQTNNEGASVARNRALEVATGTYISFIDADDTIPKNYLELLYKNIKSSRADVVVTGFNFIQDSNTLRFTNPLASGVYTTFADKIKSLYNGALWNKLFKASLIKKNNLLFEEGVMWEDNLFVIQAFYYAKKLGVIYNPCYNYEVHANSVTNSEELTDKRIEDAQFIFSKTMEFMKSKELTEEDTQLVETFLRTKAMPNYVLN